MRIILASLALLVISACSRPVETAQTPPPESAPAIDDDIDVADANDGGGASAGDRTIEEMQAESLALVDRAACESGGGEVRQEGLLGMYRCVTPYKDAGKTCRGPDECEGKCLAVEGVTGEEASGVCQSNDSPFGCYAEIVDGRIDAALCVD